jgi:hypothetical protein
MDILAIYIPVDTVIIDFYRTEIFQKKQAFKNFHKKYIIFKEDYEK